MQAFMYPMLRDDFELVETYQVCVPLGRELQLNRFFLSPTIPTTKYRSKQRYTCFCSMFG